jgi:hypothetical protein
LIEGPSFEAILGDEEFTLDCLLSCGYGDILEWKALDLG